MKNSKKILITIFVLFFIVFSKLYSQNIQQGEFMVVNNTGTSGGHNITVKIYPSGAVFHGGYEYTLKAKYPIDEPSNNKYIYGKEVVLSNDQVSGNYYTIANFDKTPEKDYCSFSLGYGKYRVEILVNNNVVNWCYVDFSDANYCVNIPNENYYYKLVIDCDPNDVLYFKYLDNNGNPTNRIPADNQIVKVWEQLGTGHGSQVPSKGDFTDYSESGQEYHNYPLNANFVPGNVGHENPEEIYLNLKLTNFDATSVNVIYFKNSTFTINSEKTFTMESISALIIEGAGGKFISKNNSSLILPLDGALVIVGPASIESNGTTFRSSSASIPWLGITLTNPGPSIINDCVFHSPRSINSYGDNVIITNNTFYITTPFGGNYEQSWGISAENVSNILIGNNHFYLPENIEMESFGVFIINTANSEEENNSSSENAGINLINNDFHNGKYQLFTCGLSEKLLQIYIDRNSFSNGKRNMELRYTAGTISNNYINSSTSINGVFLLGSAPDFRSNVINNSSFNIYSTLMSYPNFSPISAANGQYIWVAGMNSLNSNNNCNIYSYGPSFSGIFFTDYGKNNFIIENQNNFHIFGFLNTTSITYPSRGNCWYLGMSGVTPRYDIKNIDGNEMTVFYDGPPIDCNMWDDQIIDRIISSNGNGILDTILITQSSTMPPADNDFELYSLGVRNQKMKNYTTAITNFKDLINTYPNSKQLERTIFNLFECYVRSDTNHNQSWRNIVFGELKSYLEDKIQQNQTDAEFVNIAFDFLLKCRIKMKNYNSALYGYQIIVNNSPSSEQRLMASLSYIDVQGLLRGSGSGNRDIVISEIPNKNQLNKKNNEPIEYILIDTYSKLKKANTQQEILEVQNSKDILLTKYSLDNKHKYEKLLEDRASNNINISKGLTKVERRERIKNDLFILTRSNKLNIVSEGLQSHSFNYLLSQNYPNPFNSVTNIQYQILNQELVTLKVYDLLGRELKTLVNERRNPGVFIVSFDATGLSSGVYFYKMTAGDFSEVKRMVLLK